MATAADLITRAMQQLGLVQAGGTPSGNEQNMALPMLNSMLGEWQARMLNGWTSAKTVSGEQTVYSVSSAGVWTTAYTGGTTTETITPTAVSTYGTLGTTNTYPVGWEEAIEFNLAVRLGQAFGVPESVMAPVIAIATKKFEALTPKPMPVPDEKAQAPAA